MPLGGAGAECSTFVSEISIPRLRSCFAAIAHYKGNALEQIVREIDREANKIVRDPGIPSCPAVLAKLLK